MATLPVGKLAPGLLAELLRNPPGDASVVLGPGVGRDVAVVDAGGDGYLLLTADPITFATDEIGDYLVTVNANDIATAGGTPRWLLATVLLPEGRATAGTARAVQAQIEGACRAQGIALVGGHTEVAAGLDRPVAMGAMVGEVRRGDLVRSDGGRTGDVVLLSQAAGLEGSCILAREHGGALRAAGLDPDLIARCAGWLERPGLAVLPAARAARSAARVRAMHDPTEGGVATALWELAEAGALALEVDASAIPVWPETRELCGHFGLDALGLIGSGSLLLLVGAGDVDAVVAALAAAGIPCAPIGVAASSGRASVLDARSGRPLPRFDQDEITRVPSSTSKADKATHDAGGRSPPAP